MLHRLTTRSGACALLALSILALLTNGCAPAEDSGETGPAGGPVAETMANASDASTGAEKADPAPAFDYPGGWLDDGACVDICGVTPESPLERRVETVVCFDPDDAECARKTGDADYEVLMLSQHWLPSMCLGLDAGYDSTVTHKAGSRCLPEAPSRLTLHGLWPNYTGGFPQCCASGQPLDPRAMTAWPEALRARLGRDQPDPTVDGFEPARCEIFNHEWQKHGTCFANSGDLDADARAYFETGLELFDRLESANRQVDAWAGETKPRAELEALYPRVAQILCDRRHPRRLLEIRTCWSRDRERIDCPESEGFGSTGPCDAEIELPIWDGA